MAKSRKSKSNTLSKTIQKTANKTLPVVDKGLKKVGTTAKNVAEVSIPVIEKGVSTVYGTMSTGLDLGIKGVKSISKSMSKRRRSRSLAGGRKTRHRRTRHRRRD
jgi:hypothetical protein